jgi:hypothetical protein
MAADHSRPCSVGARPNHKPISNPRPKMPTSTRGAAQAAGRRNSTLKLTPKEELPLKAASQASGATTTATGNSAASAPNERAKLRVLAQHDRPRAPQPPRCRPCQGRPAARRRRRERRRSTGESAEQRVAQQRRRRRVDGRAAAGGGDPSPLVAGNRTDLRRPARSSNPTPGTAKVRQVLQTRPWTDKKYGKHHH